MAKPTEDVSWAESGSPVEPSAKRTNGYLPNDKLPAQEFNWLIRALGRWIVWLSSLFSNAGGLTQGVAGGSLVASTDGSTRDLDHAPDGDVTFLSADNLRSRGPIYLGQPTLASTEGVLAEQISGLAGARSVQVRSSGSLATGINTGAVRVTEGAPSTADMATMHPRTGSVYTRNLPKCVATIDYAWDGSGVAAAPVLNATAPHNVTSIAVNTGTVPYQVEITLTEDFTPYAVMGGIMDGSLTSPLFSVAFVRIAGSPDKIGVRLYFYQTSTDSWLDAISGGPHSDLHNVTVSVSVMCF